MNTMNIPLKITKELARIHAHLCGDGGLYYYETSEKDRNYSAEIAYWNTNTKLITSFREDMLLYFGVKMTYYPERHKLKVRSVRIAMELLKFNKYGAREWRIPNEIKKSSQEIKIEWIKAFCLDEGYCPANRNVIRIKSMNAKGLQDIQEMLLSLNITSTFNGPHCDNSFYLNIKKMGALKDFTKEKSRTYFKKK